MKDILCTWSGFKTDVIAKGFPFFYKKEFIDAADPARYMYEVYAGRDFFLFIAQIVDAGDITDFETNYKSKGNKCIFDDQGKEYLRAESRPLDCTTVFSGAGDALAIGDGADFTWDFSNNDGLVVMDSNIKRKRIEFKFKDEVYIKEGTLYFHNTLKGSMMDIYIVCPAGYYYYDNNGIPRYAATDTPIARYMIRQKMQGDCPMGDEFNTETCSCKIPVFYKFWIEITVPIQDNVSNGYVTLEMYRKRTLVL